MLNKLLSPGNTKSSRKNHSKDLVPRITTWDRYQHKHGVQSMYLMTQARCTEYVPDDYDDHSIVNGHLFNHSSFSRPSASYSKFWMPLLPAACRYPSAAMGLEMNTGSNRVTDQDPSHTHTHPSHSQISRLLFTFHFLGTPFRVQLHLVCVRWHSLGKYPFKFSWRVLLSLLLVGLQPITTLGIQKSR